TGINSARRPQKPHRHRSTEFCCWPALFTEKPGRHFPNTPGILFHGTGVAFDGPEKRRAKTRLMLDWQTPRRFSSPPALTARADSSKMRPCPQRRTREGSSAVWAIQSEVLHRLPPGVQDPTFHSR